MTITETIARLHADYDRGLGKRGDYYDQGWHEGVNAAAEALSRLAASPCSQCQEKDADKQTLAGLLRVIIYLTDPNRRGTTVTRVPSERRITIRADGVLVRQ